MTVVSRKERMRQKGKREKKEREKESGRGIAGACVSSQHTVIAIFDVMLGWPTPFHPL